MCIYVTINFACEISGRIVKKCVHIVTFGNKKVLKIKVKNISQTEKLAKIFAESLGPEGAFVTMFGDIGAGKTAFVRLLLGQLGVKEKVTSPSFVILNEYKGLKPASGEGLADDTQNVLPIYHFDLYRLENEGPETIREELREYSKPGVLTLVEWANFGSLELPYNVLNIRVSYDSEEFNDTRFYEFSSTGGVLDVLLAKIRTGCEKEGLI